MADYELKDFEKDVLETSVRHPVLVDFWAAWCGPCRVLGPIIEKLAAEAEGSWTLVKLDTDRHPELARRFQIRGIPNVKMFYKGAVVAEMSGALPEAEIRRWIQENWPGEAREALLKGTELLTEGRYDEAVSLLRTAFNAGLEQARLPLAEALLRQDPEEATGLLQTGGLSDREIALREWAKALQGDPLRGQADPAREPLAAGVEAFRAGDSSAALDNLIRSVSLNKSYAEELARKLVAALFVLLGPTHELTVENRRAFSMALY